MSSHCFSLYQLKGEADPLTSSKMPRGLSARLPFVTFPTFMVSSTEFIDSRCWGCCMQDVETGCHAQSIISGGCSWEHTGRKKENSSVGSWEDQWWGPQISVLSRSSLLCSNGEDEEEDDDGFWHDFPLFIICVFQWDQFKLPLGCSSLWRYSRLW